MHVTRRLTSFAYRSMCTKPTWTLNDVMYYIPLCPRPTVMVNEEMINALKVVDTEHQIVQDHKRKLCKELSEYFGYNILACSRHMKGGIITRFIIYGLITTYIIPSFFTYCCLALYVYHHISYVDFFTLHQRYKIHVK